MARITDLKGFLVCPRKAAIIHDTAAESHQMSHGPVQVSRILTTGDGRSGGYDFDELAPPKTLTRSG